MLYKVYHISERVNLMLQFRYVNRQLISLTKINAQSLVMYI